MVTKLILSIPAYYKYIKIFKDVVEDILELNGISEDEVFEVKLAIAEAAVNVIKHSYCCECDKKIELKIEEIENKTEEFHRSLVDRKDKYIAEVMKGIRVFSTQNNPDGFINYRIQFENIERIEVNK